MSDFSKRTFQTNFAFSFEHELLHMSPRCICSSVRYCACPSVGQNKLKTFEKFHFSGGMIRAISERAEERNVVYFSARWVTRVGTEEGRPSDEALLVSGLSWW